MELQLQQLSFTIQALGERVQLIGAFSTQVQDLVTLQRHLQNPVDHDEDTTQPDANAFIVGDLNEGLEDVHEALGTDQAESRMIKSSTNANSEQVADIRGPPLKLVTSLSRQSTLVEGSPTESPQYLNTARSFPTSLSQITCSLILAASTTNEIN